MSRLALLVLAGGVAALAGVHFGGRAFKSPAEPAMAGATARSCGPATGDVAHPGMVWIPGGSFTMGTDSAFPEEAPAVPSSVAGFWMDQTEVTNDEFAAFVAATGYRTLAERGVAVEDRPDAPRVAGSAVFRPRGTGMAMQSFANWWQFMPGADWRHPDGPQSSIEGRGRHPVVHVAYEDAQAYARWKGRSLPTEEQFEYAAQGSGRRRPDGTWAANTWQGSFPSQDTASDGYSGSAPVACYGADRHGAYDLLGNVWEWTSSAYYAGHDAAEPLRHPRGFDPTQPQEGAVAVLKGGSFLCAPDYCMRYRPEARIGQAVGLGAAHIGFRTVLVP